MAKAYKTQTSCNAQWKYEYETMETFNTEKLHVLKNTALNMIISLCKINFLHPAINVTLHKSVVNAL